VEAEGVKQVVVVSDDIGKYRHQHGRFPVGTTFHDRSELDAVQRRLRELPGVTVLIYEQTCAAEKRRRRKKPVDQGGLVDPPKRLFINEQVCEGCGDCTVQSNCVAVLPHETALGRKRRIDQSACNKDYSCANGFCPSFVGVLGGRLRKPVGALAGGAADSPGSTALQRAVAALPLPAPPDWTGPYDLLVTGVGGTGVVTVGALITMAAHLEGLQASVLDFMGFAQKGGAVLSFVRLANVPALHPRGLHQVRIDAQQADAVLACDLVVAASPDALLTVRHGRTRVLANTHEVPVAESLRNPDASLQVPQLLAKLQFAAGADRLETLDAQALAEAFLGDAIVSNILVLGYGWQRGLVPVGLAALQRAIELNGVAVANNLLAFSLGRLAAADPQALAALLAPAAGATDSHALPALLVTAAGPGALPGALPDDTLDALLARASRDLTAYQDAAYAARHAAFVQQVATRERALGADPSLPLARTVARSLHKLMAIKDEYEVARLYTDGRFQQQLRAQFDGDFQLEFHLAPPLLSHARDGQPPRKIRIGGWLLPVLGVLARARRLRGTWFDLFGHSDERRLERALITRYTERIDSLLPALSADRLALATQVAALPLQMRGFGHVKLANVALAQAREAELLHRFDPTRWPRPAASMAAGQIRGVAVVAG
jgi:indolepyruvate ferredoxin oxidoreductase